MNLSISMYSWYLFVFHSAEILSIQLVVCKVSDCSQGQPEGSLFNCYYTDV